MSGRDREFIHMIDLNESAFYWCIFVSRTHTFYFYICTDCNIFNISPLTITQTPDLNLDLNLTQDRTLETLQLKPKCPHFRSNMCILVLTTQHAHTHSHVHIKSGVKTSNVDSSAWLHFCTMQKEASPSSFSVNDQTPNSTGSDFHSSAYTVFE